MGMHIKVYFIGLALVFGLLNQACKPGKKPPTEAEEPKVPIASLAKSTYTAGDTISVNLREPLSQVTVRLDTVLIPVYKQTNSLLTIHLKSRKTGLHRLIIQGQKADKTTESDTLGIELWSDFRPIPLRYSVLKSFPHQSSSFTQGLEFHNGILYESTGLNGESKLMQVDLATGSIVKSVSLAAQYFGEGMTILNNKIYQLTWTSGVCFQYNMNFTLEKTFAYPTQGWGLTHTDSTLIMSDGSNRLYFLTPDFKRKGELAIYDNMGPVMNLNELEYVNGYVYANVWQTNRIVQIDISSGKVVGELSMESILPGSIDTKTNVLNGIAYQPKENAFYVTGKNWPTLFKIQLVNKPKKLVARR
ncbi:hypothetical protein GCM10028805_46530 [Spirosoma harenae]